MLKVIVNEEMHDYIKEPAFSKTTNRYNKIISELRSLVNRVVKEAGIPEETFLLVEADMAPLFVNSDIYSFDIRLMSEEKEGADRYGIIAHIFIDDNNNITLETKEITKQIVKEGHEGKENPDDHETFRYDGKEKAWKKTTLAKLLDLTEMQFTEFQNPESFIAKKIHEGLREIGVQGIIPDKYLMDISREYKPLLKLFNEVYEFTDIGVAAYDQFTETGYKKEYALYIKGKNPCVQGLNVSYENNAFNIMLCINDDNMPKQITIWDTKDIREVNELLHIAYNYYTEYATYVYPISSKKILFIKEGMPLGTKLQMMELKKRGIKREKEKMDVKTEERLLKRILDFHKINADIDMLL